MTIFLGRRNPGGARAPSYPPQPAEITQRVPFSFKVKCPFRVSVSLPNAPFTMHADADAQLQLHSHHKRNFLLLIIFLDSITQEVTGGWNRNICTKSHAVKKRNILRIVNIS
jgi:hypothetical protein